jgi:hypothetical protein
MACLATRLAAVALIIGLAAGAGDHTVSTSSPCFEDPTVDACADGSSFFPDSTISSKMKSLCDRMPYVSGCSIRAQCSAEKLTGKYCHQWSLAASICSGDEMSLHEAECIDFNALCSPETGTTKVQQCTEHPMVPNRPATETAFDTTVSSHLPPWM